MKCVCNLLILIFSCVLLCVVLHICSLLVNLTLDMASHSAHEVIEVENIEDRIGNNVSGVQHDTEGPSTNVSEQAEPTPEAKKPKKTSSDVWLFF